MCGLIQIADHISVVGIRALADQLATGESIVDTLTERCHDDCWIFPPVEVEDLDTSMTECADEAQQLIEHLGLGKN